VAVILRPISDVVTQLRAACAKVAELAEHVSIVDQVIPGYAAALPAAAANGAQPRPGDRERLAAHRLTLNAVNFGSGWFPTLRKRAGHTGYRTIAAGITEHGPWPAHELAEIEAAEIAHTLGQDPGHELMALFASSLRDLGAHIETEYGGSFLAAVDAGSAVALAERLGGWASFADSSTYKRIEVPFLKRAQIAAADLDRAGAADFHDLDRLTMFADNLVPHVLRLDGILTYDPALVARIEREELIVHGSAEEVEIRACAVHAVELIAAAAPGRFPAEIDELLWNRGQCQRYKASPRHRCRCTAY
jgi:hypothetical protein